MHFSIWLFEVFKVIWIASVGACVGSLINVLVYRLPLGLSVVSPPSRCPSCQTKLTWRENIPVFGWLLLGGRCRFCKSGISPEYPIVEAFVAVLFAVFYLLWYQTPGRYMMMGVNLGAIAPDWAGDRYGVLGESWPQFVLLLILLGSLTAMTIVDAKTFTIPLVLAWTPALCAIVIHPLHALCMQMGWFWESPSRALGGAGPRGEVWFIPGPGPGITATAWWWMGASVGGTIGLGIACLLLRAGLIRRSFADYDEWERAALAHEATLAAAASPNAATAAVPESGVVAAASPMIAVDTAAPAERAASADHGGNVTNSATPAERNAPGSPEMWVQYPHARREMVKEIVFLAPAVGLAVGVGYLFQQFPVWFGSGYAYDAMLDARATDLRAPLWFSALSACLLGYLIGGAVVWVVRILGSLLFGKEAMGLGDVHLMCAVGAVLGWIDSTLAFFAAAFVGLAWALLGAVFRGGMLRQLPYGPHLAVATVLVLLGKPLIEMGLSALAGHRINLP